MEIPAAAALLALFCLTITPVTVKADDQQDRDACMMDAETVCGQFIPDRVQVAPHIQP
jgi:hypothetical protein